MFPQNAPFKKNVLTFCIISISLYLSVLTLVYTIDPFYIFHKSLFRNPKYPEDHVYLNLGLIRNYLDKGATDTILVSASYLWEFNADDISESINAKKTLKLCLPSIYPYESYTIVNKACSTGRVKNVFLQMDIEGWTWYPAHSLHPERDFPFDLYKSPYKLLLLPYLWDGLKTSVLMIFSQVFNRDKFCFFYRQYPWRFFNGLNQLYNSWTMPEISIGRYENFQKQVDCMGNNQRKEQKFEITNIDEKITYTTLDEHLTPLLIKYPQINFYLIIPPFSKYFYQSFYGRNKRNLSDVFAFLLQLVNIGENFKNVKIYGFDDCSFTTNLRNYHDKQHTSPEINKYMLYAIKNGKHLLNAKNIDIYIKNFVKTLNDFSETDQLDNHRNTFEDLVREDFR